MVYSTIALNIQLTRLSRRVYYKFTNDYFLFSLIFPLDYRLGPFAWLVLSSPPALPLRVLSASCHHYYRPADFPTPSTALTRLFCRDLKRSVLPIPSFDCLRLPLYRLHQHGLTVRIVPCPLRPLRNAQRNSTPGYKNPAAQTG